MMGVISLKTASLELTPLLQLLPHLPSSLSTKFIQKSFLDTLCPGCPRGLSRNCAGDIHPNNYTKTALLKVTSDFHVAKSNSQLSSLPFPELRAAQGTAQHSLLPAYLTHTPQAAEQPPGGLVTSLATLPAPLLLLYPPQPGNARVPRTPFFLATSVHTGYVICSAQCKVITQAPRLQIITTSKTAAAKQESKPQHRLRARPLQRHSRPRLGRA